MKWEDYNWGILLLGICLLMLYFVLASCAGTNKCSNKLGRSCPEKGHGPCPFCEQINYDISK